MVCRQCGTEIADKAIICYKCGTATAIPAARPAGSSGRTAGQGIPGWAWALLAAVAVAVIWRLTR